jgi:excinuclease UvrABC helicase subunit UvrB
VDLEATIAEVEQQMRTAAADLAFEAAAQLRDQLFDLRARLGGKAARPTADVAAER